MRVVDYLGTSLRDIARQPGRALLTIIALVISSSLFVALVTLGLQTREALTKQLFSDTSVNSIVVTSNKTVGSGFFGNNVQTTNSSSGKIDDTAIASFKAIKGVKDATPVVSVWEFKSFVVSGYEKSFIAKTSAINSAQADSLALSAGGTFTANASDHSVIIGSGYARALGIEKKPDQLIGKTITLKTQNGYRGEGATLPRIGATKDEQSSFANSPTTLEATIVGVSTATQNDSLIYIPLSWARQIQSPQTWSSNGTIQREDLIAKNGYSSALVQADNSPAIRPVSTAIDNMGYGTNSKQKQIDQINQLSTVMWIVLGSIALISLISACLGIVNTMLMAVSEQRYAISVWRACGATKSMIARMFLLQALFLGLVGGAIGTTFGVFVSQYVNQRIASVLVAQGLESVTIAGPSLKLIVLSILLTTLLAIIAGLYPAYRAARKIQI